MTATLAAIPDPAAGEPDERVRELYRVIHQLDDLNRALVLLYLEGRDYREIAEVLGITETNVATKLNRLKERMRQGRRRSQRVKEHVMELDDLKVAWAQMEQRVSAAETLVLKLQTESRLDRMRRTLRRLGWGKPCIAFSGSGSSRWSRPSGSSTVTCRISSSPGSCYTRDGVAVICVGVVQLLLIARTYYTAPIVTFQGRLAELERFRIVTGLATGLPWWILWAVVAVVGAEKFLHVDLYAHSTLWFWNSVAVGWVGIAVSLLVARRLAKCKLARAAQLASEAAQFARD